MNERVAQEIELRSDGRWYIKYDWYPNPLPENLEAEDNVNLDTTYSFACFHSLKPHGCKIGFATGNYLHSHFYAGESGTLAIGKYVILETTHLLANQSITIGDHCMFSWGSVLTDSWLHESTFPHQARKEILERIAFSQTRFPDIPDPREIVVEDNVWVGFGAVILPGVRLGRGCIVGCKAVISEDVPPYAVIVGNPPKIVKFLLPDDTEEERLKSFQKFSNQKK